MTTCWDELLLAFLHDPPDKALSVSAGEAVPSHESRRGELAKALLGSDQVSRSKIKVVTAAVDVMASKVERLPMPKNQHVNVQDGRLIIAHPLAAGESGGTIEICVPQWDKSLFNAEINELLRLADGFPGQDDASAFNRFLGVWRLWPDALAEKVDSCFALLPAETRIPDHTIWNHLDVTTGLKAAEADKGTAALFAFALGPVQQFIEAARSVRDLWSGSMILSWLVFQAMLPVIEWFGPTALVYPALRGNALLDMWLRRRLGDKVSWPEKEVAQRVTPSLPHRFLALVPWGDEGLAAWNLAAQCRQAASNAWKEMADAVRKKLNGRLDSSALAWDKRWDDQIANYFTASTAIIPLAGSGEEVDGLLAGLLAGENSFAKAFPGAEAVRRMAEAIPVADRPGYPQDHAGRWQYQVELVQRSLAAQRAIRHVPRSTPSGNSNTRYPQKCTLLGSFEQMGPDDLAKSNTFWDKAADSQNGLRIDGVRLRRGEALCAVALVKRFAWPAFLAKKLNVRPEDLRFPDTWTIAAGEWLAMAEKEYGIELGPEHVQPWNGQWLHWSKRDQDLGDADECPAGVFGQIREVHKLETCGAPPTYYAILKLDGDDLGAWLRGKKSPKVREVMHPNLVRYYEELGNSAKTGLEAKRPVGPALHAAISTALANFALHAVPEIVARHHGTTIYSGGDDTLILLPVSTALACALELRQAYMSGWWCPNKQSGRQGNPGKCLMMGSRATLSGGLVLVHAKDDLRLALQDVRRAEKHAKDTGKDALVITVRRRSGEHTSALCPWDFAPTVQNWQRGFAEGASDRWAYRLYAERPALEQLPVDAIKAEVRRQLSRAEAPTPSLIAPDDLVAAFDRLRGATIAADGGSKERFPSMDVALRAFLILCHTASFLARGRD